MLLIPDAVLAPGAELTDSLSRVLPETAIPQVIETIASSHTTPAGLTGVVVRVKEIFIIRNKSGVLGIGNSADIYPIILVANGESQDPVKFSLPNMFNNIGDRMALPIAEPGIDVSRNFNNVPEFLDIHVLLMKSKKKQRDFATALTTTLASDEGKSIIDSIGKLVQGGTAGIVLNISSALLQVFLKFLGAQEDKQLFYGVGSFDKQIDALGIGKEHVFTDNNFARVTIEIIGIPTA